MPVYMLFTCLRKLSSINSNCVGVHVYMYGFSVDSYCGRTVVVCTTADKIDYPLFSLRFLLCKSICSLTILIIIDSKNKYHHCVVITFKTPAV